MNKKCKHVAATQGTVLCVHFGARQVWRNHILEQIEQTTKDELCSMFAKKFLNFVFCLPTLLVSLLDNCLFHFVEQFIYIYSHIHGMRYYCQYKTRKNVLQVFFSRD